MKRAEVTCLLILVASAIYLSCSNDDSASNEANAGQGGRGTPDALGLAGAGAAVVVGGTTGAAGNDVGPGGTAMQGHGGAGGVGVQWSCGDGYQLESYDGDQQGLCPAAESAFMYEDDSGSFCCPGDVAAVYVVRCAPDTSVCLGGMICTGFEGAECGWTGCDLDRAEGGAGGAEEPGCPRDKVVNPAPLRPCALDAHCKELDLLCNLRIANRMFCGELGSSGQGGSGG